MIEGTLSAASVPRRVRLSVSVHKEAVSAYSLYVDGARKTPFFVDENKKSNQTVKNRMRASDESNGYFYCYGVLTLVVLWRLFNSAAGSAYSGRPELNLSSFCRRKERRTYDEVNSEQKNMINLGKLKATSILAFELRTKPIIML